MPPQSIEFNGHGGIMLRGTAFGLADDPPVVLLPAGGQHHSSLLDAGRALGAAGRYAVCLDLRGHGESDWATNRDYSLGAYVEDVKLVLQQLPARPVILALGLSSMTATLAAAEMADDAISGLVLVGVSPWMDAAAIRSAVKRLEDQVAGFETVEEAMRARQVLRPHEEPLGDPSTELRVEDGRYYWHWDPAIIGQFQTGQALARFSQAAVRLRMPVLVVRGGLDRMLSEESAARLRDLIPGAELINFEQTGYLAATDDSDVFNAALLEFLERRVPREPETFEAGADQATLREALGCFGTGITVVTAYATDGTPVGITANSFTSVSLDPPLLLFCVGRHSSTLPVFEEACRFAVNVLHIGQQPASMRFATPGLAEKYQGIPWERWGKSAPILQHTLASFDCVRHAIHEAGDHKIFVGRVLRVRFEPRRDPLLYFRGKYRRLHFS